LPSPSSAELSSSSNFGMAFASVVGPRLLLKPSCWGYEKGLLGERRRQVFVVRDHLFESLLPSRSNLATVICFPSPNTPSQTMSSLTMFVLGCGTMGIAITSGKFPPHLASSSVLSPTPRSILNHPLLLGVLQSLLSPLADEPSSSGASTPIADGEEPAPQLERFIIELRSEAPASVSDSTSLDSG
jgi:hypothetical protein